MNVNEYGITIQFCVSFNMSAYSTLSFTFTKPDGTLLTVPGNLGLTTVSTPLGTFTANTYATYTFVQGNVNLAGDWEVRLTYTDSSPAKLISTIGHFTVLP